MSLNKIYAFFDVDGTILRIPSLQAFQKTRCDYTYGQSKRSRDELNKVKSKFERLQKANYSREYINRIYYMTFKNNSKKKIKKIAQIWWKTTLEQNKNLFIQETLDKLRWHKEKKHKIVLVSGSFMEVMSPIADYLNADHVIAITLEVQNGLYTGNIKGLQTIGDGKKEAILQFAKKRKVNLDSCYSYGDHISDMPMLELVGNPTVISGDSKLDTIAATRGWQSIRA
jgi:HAD superfamily hydrolase (TIGR01490 family)